MAEGSAWWPQVREVGFLGGDRTAPSPESQIVDVVLYRLVVGTVDSECLVADETRVHLVPVVSVGGDAQAQRVGPRQVSKVQRL